MESIWILCRAWAVASSLFLVINHNNIVQSRNASKSERLCGKKQNYSDPEYKENQKLSNQKWFLNNPDYWKNYRRKNPKKTIRNRMLQRVRNRMPHGYKDVAFNKIIAKMDARKPSEIKLEGGFWLVPTIASY